MLSLYITSNNKKEGKTFLTSGLAATMQSLGYTTSVYKPIQTSGREINGFMQSPDLTAIKSVDPYINTHFTYLFKSASEPLIASECENHYIDLNNIINDYNKILSKSDCVIVDGDGGLMSPLAPSLQNINMLKMIRIPTLFVITPNTDSINNVLLAIYAAKEHNIDIRGVIINNIKENSDKNILTSMTRIIEEYSDIKILGLLPYLGEKVLPEDLISGILNGIDIESVFNVKIEKLDFC